MLNKPGYELNVFGDTDGSRKRYYNVGYYEYLQPEEDSGTTTSRPTSFTSRSPTCGWKSARATRARATARSTSPRSRIPRPARLTETATCSRATRSADALGEPARERLVHADHESAVLRPAADLDREVSNFRELARPKSLDFTGPGAGSWTYDPASREFDPDGVGPDRQVQLRRPGPVDRVFSSASSRNCEYLRLDRRAPRPAAEGGAVPPGHHHSVARRCRIGSCIAPGQRGTVWTETRDSGERILCVAGGSSISSGGSMIFSSAKHAATCIRPRRPMPRRSASR